MAKLVKSDIIKEIRGKVGDKVYSKNHYGYSVGKVQKAPKGFTPFQKNWQTVFKYLANLWPQISQEQRDRWNNFARTFRVKDKLGNSFSYTGQNLFTMLNAKRILINCECNYDAPRVKPIVQLFKELKVDAYYQGEDFRILLDLKPAINQKTVVLVHCSKPFSPGVSRTYEHIRIIGLIDSQSKLPLDISFSYLESYKINPAAGKKLFVQITPIDKETGFEGSIIKSYTIVGERN